MKNSYPRRPKKLAGFTLLELIVVIAIIGILTSIAVPSTVSMVRDSKIESANTMAQELYSAAQNYLTDKQIKNQSVGGVESGKAVVCIKGRDTWVPLNSIGISSPAKITDADGTSDIVPGIRKYVGDTIDEEKGFWVFQFDADTYTVDYVLYCDQDNAEAQLMLVNNSKKFYKAIFGNGSEGTTQEVDARKEGMYVGQYPIPYQN
ncbi:MAG: type II secretion system protein [Oscillospiraceae bacterium]|nr:type II secretion system protein [Oscillospiraceae bacterium]